MIRIAVIDDEKEILDEICLLIQKSFAPEDYAEVQGFQSAEKLLENVGRGARYDILFSDIDLNGMSGMELGRIVAEKLSQIYLIFITSYAEFAAESYLIRAYQYILKRDMRRRIPEIVKQLKETIRKETKTYIWVGTETCKRKICCRDIIYISKSKSAKYVQFFTINGKYKERTTLNQVMTKLQGKEFIMVERGYIVNMEHMVRMENDTIYLENNEKVTISRARLAKVKQEISDYWRDEMK